MLIECPECGKEVSDKSKVCIGCGYPLADNEASDVLKSLRAGKDPFMEIVQDYQKELIEERRRRRILPDFSFDFDLF